MKKSRVLSLLALVTAMVVFVLIRHEYPRYSRGIDGAKRKGSEPTRHDNSAGMAHLQNPPATPVTAINARSQPAPSSIVPGAVAAQASRAEATALPTPLVVEPQENIHSDLEMMRTVIRDYRAVFGENPVGSNEEITRALTGANSRHVSFLSAESPGLNPNGELIDRWGTPYFFHQLSGQSMEIRSAGPDRRMWDADDVYVQ